MFQVPRYIQNSFSIVFARQAAIRRLANKFEDKLKDLYSQPQILPIPDEFEPELPRIVFGSTHGYSQIAISQVSAVLTVTYSEEWQLDAGLRRQYLKDRVPILFDLVALTGSARPFYKGLTTHVNIPSTSDDTAIVNHLARLFLQNPDASALYDIQLRLAEVRQNTHFSNALIQNYRTYEQLAASSDPQRYPKTKAVERGIRVIGDYNDRYAFNEQPKYRTSREKTGSLIDEALQDVATMVSKIEEAIQ
jgi:hypothetical protein